jgi:hypothetical protein
MIRPRSASSGTRRGAWEPTLRRLDENLDASDAFSNRKLLNSQGEWSTLRRLDENLDASDAFSKREHLNSQGDAQPSQGLPGQIIPRLVRLTT